MAIMDAVADSIRAAGNMWKVHPELQQHQVIHTEEA